MLCLFIRHKEKKMNSGFYAAGTGMVTRAIAMNHITDNLSYGNVAGYKKQEVLFLSFDEALERQAKSRGPGAVPSMASGLDLVQGHTDFSQGKLHFTGNKQDVALEGAGFFEVQDGGQKLYTRMGAFRINDEKELVTNEGYKVIGENGTPITFDQATLDVNKHFNIDEDGTVYLVDNSRIPIQRTLHGKVRVAEFTSPEKLDRLGYGFWKVGEEDPGKLGTHDTKFRQEYQEMSNANTVESMVDMIFNQRVYQANSNFLRTMHDNAKKLMQVLR